MIFPRFLVLILSLLAVDVALAQTRYVSDELEITLRNGQGLEFGIRKMLKSGTRLQVLQNNSDSGYSQVRTAEGVEGWVLTRYLSQTGSARDLLAENEQKLANLELEVANYKTEIEQLSSQNNETDTQNLSLKETSQRLRKELDDLRRTASSAVALENENRQLKQKLQEMDSEIQTTQIENNALRDNSTKSWFLIGAAVLFAGIVLGLILPRLRLRRKSSWGSL
ncbi:SH3 domain protein [Methylophaga frappieri]|uniref:SH3 domain protein n=1 Tax=Methylophaga frappieri (strain ATCC BAA-2434 / DSM 25690 / JAM7) TaxID=754477 RepID=I1YIZ6_METFJ|nr:TIGR04211 family SH3 domain-containing protein [Methylophaga frappieri]AFJ02889.1 SH3 domain protein [Methylophaga frappieri]